MFNYHFFNTILVRYNKDKMKMHRFFLITCCVAYQTGAPPYTSSDTYIANIELKKLKNNQFFSGLSESRILLKNFNFLKTITS